MLSEPDGGGFVGGCVLFGVPNLGSAVATNLKVILTSFKSAGILENEKIEGLEQDSSILLQIGDDFRQIRNIHKIPVLCCWEKKKTHGVIVGRPADSIATAALITQ
jgi:hypothetical protein